jgi:hypothetical protein
MRRIARQLSSSSTMITRTITGRGVAGGLKRTKSSDDALVSILQNKKVIFTVTYVSTILFHIISVPTIIANRWQRVTKTRLRWSLLQSF